MMDEIADLYAVRKSFKLAFCALREQTLAWEKCMNNCSPHLRAIATLREIQTNCRTAKLVGTELLSKYPDIRERVLCNVENELLGERDRLESVLKDLKKSQNILSSACQQAIQAYEQQSQSLSAEDICYRSEVCPSVADMLEWITSAEQEFGSHVHARELLLEEANFGDDFKTATFVKEWKDDAALLESLNVFVYMRNEVLAIAHTADAAPAMGVFYVTGFKQQSSKINLVTIMWQVTDALATTKFIMEMS